jgi:hypothetical protein
MTTTTPNLTAWQHAFRHGIVPQFTTKGLQGLRKALQENSPKLITGSTMLPPPLQCTIDWQVEACCPLSYALLDGLSPYAVCVGRLDELFAMACYRADQLLGEPAAVRWFLNTVDEWTRGDLLRNLLPEVELALAQRETAVAAA